MILAPAAGPEVIQSHSNPWAEPLYIYPSQWDYRVMFGGRGASKTHEISKALIYHGHQRPLRIAVAREHKVSIGESAQPELIARAEEFGILRPDCYRATRTSIDHVNGTHIFFIGLSTVSEEDIKGLAKVDILWIEEAHQMSHSSWRLVYPTIRKDGSEIWISFNPQYRHQIAWQLAQRTHNPRYWIRRVTWRDNDHFTARNNRDRLDDKADNPLMYDHIWEGQPDDAGAAKKVLPYNLLRKCVDSYHKRPVRGAFKTAGFDVADTGAASNTLCLRSGPELFGLHKWKGSELVAVSDSAVRAANLALEESVRRMNYDASGVGAGVRGPMRDHLRKKNRRMYVNACMFNGAVQGADVIYLRARPRGITNKAYFRNWGTQAAMVLRQRAEYTERLEKGQEIDLHRCLFINPEIPDLEDVLADFSQAEWDDDTGKLRVVKQPHGPGEPEPDSPDCFDAARLAYAYDARHGLRQASR